MAVRGQVIWGGTAQLSVGSVDWRIIYFSSPRENSRSVTFTISKGDTGSDVAKSLAIAWNAQPNGDLVAKYDGPVTEFHGSPTTTIKEMRFTLETSVPVDGGSVAVGDGMHVFQEEVAQALA